MTAFRAPPKHHEGPVEWVRVHLFDGVFNSILTLLPGLSDFWTSSYFRGALSGLGVLNIYISIGELLRLRRPARPGADGLPA